MFGKIKKNYFLIISVFLIIYFFFNFLEGERGLFSYFKKNELLINLKNQEINLTNKIHDIEFKNSLLSNKLNLDYVEEIIREKLSNMSDNDKKVLESLANGDTSDLNLSEEEESMFKKMISVMNESEESTTEGMKEGNKPSLKPKSLKPKKKELKTTDPKPAEQSKKNLKTIEKETMDVRNQQKELMTSMKSLEPMLTEAKQFMENFKKK